MLFIFSEFCGLEVLVKFTVNGEQPESLGKVVKLMIGFGYTVIGTVTVSLQLAMPSFLVAIN
jgi:hypothetical protein